MKYFSIEELTFSSTALKYNIDNTPTPEIVEHLKELIDVLDELREFYGHPIYISSGFRCEELNKKVGGSKQSAHMTGYAVDMQVKGDYDEFVRKVKEFFRNRPMDQLIEEKNKNTKWLHFGLRGPNNVQRHQIFNINL